MFLSTEIFSKRRKIYSWFWRETRVTLQFFVYLLYFKIKLIYEWCKTCYLEKLFFKFKHNMKKSNTSFILDLNYTFFLNDHAFILLSSTHNLWLLGLVVISSDNYIYATWWCCGLFSCDTLWLTCTQRSSVPVGLVVRIRRSHRRGRGSIPRLGEQAFFSFFLLQMK